MSCHAFPIQIVTLDIKKNGKIIRHSLDIVRFRVAMKGHSGISIMSQLRVL